MNQFMTEVSESLQGNVTVLQGELETLEKRQAMCGALAVTQFLLFTAYRLENQPCTMEVRLAARKAKKSKGSTSRTFPTQ